MSEANTSSKPNFLISALWQIIPVMLGVFLGLWVNNLNEDRKQAKLQTQVLQKIKQDIESNRQQLMNVIDYHRSLGDTARFILNSISEEDITKTRLDLGRDNPYDVWEGTRTGPLRDGGYQTAINTGQLANMDFEFVSLLSEIEQDQAHYASMSNLYLETTINMGIDVKMIDNIIFITSFSIDILYLEEKLIDLYDQALEKLNN